MLKTLAGKVTLQTHAEVQTTLGGGGGGGEPRGYSVVMICAMDINLIIKENELELFCPREGATIGWFQLECLNFLQSSTSNTIPPPFW